MSVDIILKDIEWDGVNKIRVPLEGGGTQDFSIGGGTPTLQTKSKTYTPTASQQTESVQADSGYDGLDTVNITVNAMPSGTEGTPTATKGAVSNHSVTVTPSVTNSAGYISGGTKTGNAVTVTATELASGNLPITQNADNINVVGYSSVSVNVQGGIGTLLATKSLGTISTNSTTATDTGQTVSVSGINGYDLLIVETSVDTKTNNRHASTMQCIWLTASSTIGTKSGSAIASATMNDKLSSNGTATSRSNTTKYGIYVNSVSISNGSAALTMYQRYNSTQTGTINGSYTTRVYGVNLYNLIGG